MASLKILLKPWLFLLMYAQFSSAQTEETPQKTALPELPPEETRAQDAPKETSSIVVNYDEAKTAFPFLPDSSATERPSRQLDLLDLSGDFYTGFNFFRNGHLGTYIPDRKIGTSMMPPELSMTSKTSDSEEQNPAQNKFFGAMRLRVNPTINVSEVVRLKSRIDVFDNMVLGSTPSYLTQSQAINSWRSALNLKRAWAEASFPIGELRFGRMPFHFGLGLLYNSGDDIRSHYGDQIDGITFTSRVFDHFLSAGYSVAFNGPSIRGGGLSADDFQSSYLSSEAGLRYPLDSSGLTHVFMLSFLKRESDFITNKKREEGRAIFNYGIFASYRRQYLDTQGVTTGAMDDASKQVVKRDSNIGLASLWSSFSIGNFYIETEAAGVFGKYRIGEKDTDILAKDEAGKAIADQSVWLLQGGVAVESKYGFLNDRLQVGLDLGWASSQDGAGFGLRESNKKNLKPGDVDNGKLPSGNAYKTNFKFNPAYTVDLLMYREVLGGVSGTFYLKPHLAYFFSRNFGVRADVIGSIAPNKSNTFGDSNWLGVELDTSVFLRSENGFYFQLAHGLLIPLQGLNHSRSTITTNKQYETFGKAQLAQTLQAYFGVTF